jgi:hypothetical protein
MRLVLILTKIEMKMCKIHEKLNVRVIQVIVSHGVVIRHVDKKISVIFTQLFSILAILYIEFFFFF